MCLKHRTQVLLFMIGLVYLMVLLGCNEAPFEPKDDEPVVKDYKVWYWNAGNRYALYNYNTISGTIDSVVIPWQVSGDITVSHDGRLVYVPSGSLIGVFGTDSLQPVLELPYSAGHGVIVSPKGNYIAIPGDSSVILRTSDYEVVFSVPFRLGFGKFTGSGAAVWATDYGGTFGDICSIVKGDTGWSVQFYRFEGIGRPYEVIPTPDESRLLLCGNKRRGLSYFAVYDVALDSVIFSDHFSPGLARLVMSPDGRKAYYGNPGAQVGISPDPPTSEITEFDIEANQITRRIDTRHFVDSITPDFMPIGSVIISPDSRWLVALKGPSGTSLIKYDLVEDRFVDYREITGMGLNLSIQLIP